MCKSIFGIDITGDGKADLQDDLIIMNIIDGDKADDKEDEE